MDVSTIVEFAKTNGITVVSSVTASVAATKLLSKGFVNHWFSVREKDHEARNNKELAEFKVKLEAQLRKEVDGDLGELSIERAYRAEAKKRLYVAVGPLRFQLLLAASDLAQRIIGIGNGQYEFVPSIEDYFGQSTIYRILRVFAVSELIERQIGYADFAVDPEMRSLLAFKQRAFQSLSSSKVSLGHPLENWDEQIHHVYYDVLQIVGSSLVVQDSESSPGRVMHFDEFSKKVTDGGFVARLDPLPRLMSNFTVSSKPIVWLRLLALAHLCVQFLRTHGTHLGLNFPRVEIDRMLSMSKDEYIRQHSDRYRDAITSFEISSTSERPNGTSSPPTGSSG